jgi:hypothetical protein
MTRCPAAHAYSAWAADEKAGNDVDQRTCRATPYLALRREESPLSTAYRKPRRAMRSAMTSVNDEDGKLAN